MFISICTNPERRDVQKHVKEQGYFCSVVIELPGEDVECPDRLIAVVGLKEPDVQSFVMSHVAEAVEARNWLNRQVSSPSRKRA